MGPSKTQGAVSRRNAIRPGKSWSSNVRSVSDQPLAFFASAIAGRHVGRSPGLVDKDEPSRIEARLHFAPIGARGLDISPALLGGAKSFF